MPRLTLHARLAAILGSDNVYFQPPSGFMMNYPCIVYKRDSAETRFADDVPYVIDIRYQVTVISKDPDNTVQEAVSWLPKCTRVRTYNKDGLIHDVFNVYA